VIAARLTARRALGALAAAALCAALAGCGSGDPLPVSRGELAEARSFPYFKLYWVGPRFQGIRLVSTDGRRSYSPTYGDSVYYGNCIGEQGLEGGGTCHLPLQVKTVVFVRHSNDALGQQRNVLLRGVPASIYDAGHAIELFTGQVQVDVFTNSLARSLAAVSELRPVNASGSPDEALPPPVYCPELVGPVPADVAAAMRRLPHRVCRETQRRQELADAIYGEVPGGS